MRCLQKHTAVFLAKVLLDMTGDQDAVIDLAENSQDGCLAGEMAPVIGGWFGSIASRFGTYLSC